MHGGAPGSGGPKGARNGNVKHGRYTAETIATRQWLREKIREVRAFDQDTSRPAVIAMPEPAGLVATNCARPPSSRPSDVDGHLTLRGHLMAPPRGGNTEPTRVGSRA
jgi:hypothetical protein